MYKSFIPEIEYVSRKENENKVRQAINDNRYLLEYYLKKIFGLNNTPKKPHPEKDNNYNIPTPDTATANHDTPYINPEKLYPHIIPTEILANNPENTPKKVGRDINLSSTTNTSKTIGEKITLATNTGTPPILKQTPQAIITENYRLDKRPNPQEADFQTVMNYHNLWIDDPTVYKNRN
jgi:hypothetical protein